MARSKRVRRIDPRRAKTHFSYTIAEAAALFDVHRNTVRHWTKRGLETVKARGGELILGDELRAYLARTRAKRREPSPPGSMYCLKCRAARRPDPSLTDAVTLSPAALNLRGICPECGTLMHRRANLAHLDKIGFGQLAPHGGGSTPSR